MKKHITYIMAAALGLALAGPASAACYADYKAKRDNPLKLHYGVIELSQDACLDPGLAELEAAERISGSNWKLLNVLSTFGDKGLNKRKKSAGKYFLRF